MHTIEDLTSNAVAIDIETTGFEWKDRMLTVSMARRGPDGKAYSMVLNIGYIQKANLFGLAFGDSADSRDKEIVPLKPNESRLAFQAFIEGASCLIFHNGSFDIPYIVRSGLFTSEEIKSHLIFDTMVWARCTAGHNSVALDALLDDYGIKVTDEWKKTKEIRNKLAEQPWDKVEYYSRMDAEYTLELGIRMIPKAVEYYESQGHALIDEESAWVELIARLRNNGMQIDVDGVRDKLVELKQESAVLLRDLMSYKIQGPNHTTSILRWIATINQIERLDITPKSGKPSISKASLEKLTGEAEHVVGIILNARRIEKEISTWVEAPLDQADSAGRIHPMFTVSGAKSNRLTAKNPSPHTFPKSMENLLLTARPGYRLIILDYKAAELRVAASFAKEQVLVEEFQKPDADPHLRVARLIFGEEANSEDRRRTKNAIFARNYGGGPRRFIMTANKGLEEDDSIYLTFEEGEKIYNQIKANMPGITKTAKAAENLWLTRGYLKVLGGKRVYASKVDLEKSYKAFNYLIQPSVAELIKKAMIQIDREVEGVILVSQKHDSIAMELPDDDTLTAKIEQVKNIMVGSYPQYMIEMTSPPVYMQVDLEANKKGLPFPTEG